MQESNDKLFTDKVLRLVALDDRNHPISMGTAFFIRPNLLMTAKHVLGGFYQEILQDRKFIFNGIKLDELRLWAIQVTDDDFYVWAATNTLYPIPGDLCLLEVIPTNNKTASSKICPTLNINLRTPDVGDMITGFGFYDTKFNDVVVGPDGTLLHAVLQDKTKKSVGIVEDIITEPSSMHPFPTYGVNTYFPHGMSGGPVINNKGELCGIVCSAFDFGPDVEPYSRVSSLAPLASLIRDGYKQIEPQTI